MHVKIKSLALLIPILILVAFVIKPPLYAIDTSLEQSIYKTVKDYETAIYKKDCDTAYSLLKTANVPFQEKKLYCQYIDNLSGFVLYPLKEITILKDLNLAKLRKNTAIVEFLIINFNRIAQEVIQDHFKQQDESEKFTEQIEKEIALKFSQLTKSNQFPYKKSELNLVLDKNSQWKVVIDWKGIKINRQLAKEYIELLELSVQIKNKTCSQDDRKQINSVRRLTSQHSEKDFESKTEYKQFNSLKALTKKPLEQLSQSCL